ncbi:hypothetical protein RHMOL_Rhmol02G0219300 [Rhododendron molle]|uniref:Uncharacterized protein n=1 Tax=Rhododendron molle TaxID=49168 RepID=A0ACC0PUK6_RHOML|nr:hypothetical protein RHMOL_Rhmol02G0219300 [Rhododendron molle]
MQGITHAPSRNSSQPQNVEDNFELDHDLVEPFAEREVGIQDESGVRNKREITRLSDVWNLPPTNRIVVKFNEAFVPIGYEGGLFNRFVAATVSRKPHLCPINCLDWHKVPQHYKEACWIIIRSKFLIPENSLVSEAIKRNTLKLLGTRLRDWRCTLKNKYFDQTKTAAQIVATAPPTVNREHFADLVSYWFSDEGEAKIKELLPNSLEGNSKGSIYWSPNDVYSQAINKKEWSGHVRGCGFGPTPKSSRSTCNDFPRFNVADEEERMRDKQTICELQDKVQSQAAEMSTLKEQMAIVMRHNGLQALVKVWRWPGAFRSTPALATAREHSVGKNYVIPVLKTAGKESAGVRLFGPANMQLRSILKKGFDGSENNNVKGFYDKIELVYANVFDNLRVTPDRSSVDWTKHGVLNEVRDQRNCVFGFLDCCWAVVSSAATEALYNIKNRPKKPFQIAPQEMINCLKKNRTTCYTSSINDSFRFAKEFGVRREVDCPFQATKQPCYNKLVKMPALRVKSFKKIEDGDEIEGIYQGPSVEPQIIGLHAILIVGSETDEETGEEYWKIQNSWGVTWGIEGYAKIRKSSPGKKSLLQRISYPEEVEYFECAEVQNINYIPKENR